MSVRDLLRLAVGNLRENRLRTVLCALSVAVGAGALLLIAALGLLGQQKLSEGIRTLGVSGLTVYVDDRGAGQALSATVADAMAQAVSGVECVMPIKAQSGTVRAGHASENVLFLGVDERLGEVMQLDVLAGDLLTRTQAQAAQPVAVVGDTLAQALYGRDNIVGRTIRLRLGGCDQDFTVCGVVRSQTSALGTAVASLAPHLVYIPYACLATSAQSADQVFVQCMSGADLSAVSGRISRYLTDRVQVDGTVRVQNMSGVADTVNRMAELGVGLFTAVGGVTLCVAHKGEQAQRRHQQVRGLRVQKQVQLGRVLRPGPLDAHVAFHRGQLRLQGDQLAVVLKDAAQVGGEVQHQILDGTVLFLLCQGVHQVQAV